MAVGTIRVDGVATGLNTTGLIDEMVAAQSRYKTRLQARSSQITDLASRYSTLNSRLSSLDSALAAIEDFSDFRSFTATVPSTAPYSITADGDAVAGSYPITINSLAKAQMDKFTLDDLAVSGEFSSRSTAIFSAGEAGTLTFSVNGTDTDIDVDDTTTLSELASLINEVDGISAYVVQTATEAATGSDKFSLIIQADDSGEYQGGSRYTITSSLTAGQTGSFDNTQAATNASITVAGTNIESASNTITAIDGLTIVANDTGSATATVSLDTTAMANKVQDVVEAYNAVVSFIATNSTTSSSGTNQTNVSLGAFVGESAPRMILQRLSSLISHDYASDLGLSQSTDRTALSQLGVSTQQSGLLSFSSATFIEQLGTYQDNIEELFSDTTGSFSAAMRAQLDEFTGSSGSLQSLQTSLTNENTRVERALDYEEARLAKYRSRLEYQFNQLESITSMFSSSGSFLTSFFAPQTSN